MELAVWACKLGSASQNLVCMYVWECTEVGFLKIYFIVLIHIWQNNQATDSGHKKEEVIKYVEFCKCIWYSVYYYKQQDRPVVINELLILCPKRGGGGGG